LDPGRDRENTSLHEEGAADLAPGPIIEAFARHFLAWLNLWEDQGLASLWAPWSGRALGHDEAAVFDGPKGRITGRIDGITADGNLRVKTAKGLRSLPLRHVLDGRGWSAAGGA
jgi:BirA family biotin operon repressor/biotin-[acetyl-CoA-carboxylase] ligase